MAANVGREIVLSRVFAAPRALVWQALTDPQHVGQWWGPRGFGTDTDKMDFRVGGSWAHTMIGPDGTRYPNKSVYKEIVPLERIVYSHGGGREDGQGANFVATWLLEDAGKNGTRLTIRQVFPSAEMRAHVVREYGAVEGGKQTLARLAEHLPAMQSRPFETVREFNAPRELVWAAWTEEKHLRQWFGPKGCTLSRCSLDFRPGGVFHYCMRTPDGHEMWGKWTFREIVPPRKLVLVSSFSDAQGGITRPPMSATWPRETLSTTTLEERDGKTILTLRWVALNATDEERRTFDGAHDSMKQGWGGTMDQLATYLVQAQL
ncbi:MAG: SRPBCC family protein [Lacunisphaera sp.]